MASKADKIEMVKKALAEKAANKKRLVQELLSAAENNPSIKKAAEEKLMTKSALGLLGKVLAQAAKAAPQAGRVARPLAASARNTARALGPNMPQINRLAATPMAGGGNIRRVALPSPRPADYRALTPGQLQAVIPMRGAPAPLNIPPRPVQGPPPIPQGLINRPPAIQGELVPRGPVAAKDLQVGPIRRVTKKVNADPGFEAQALDLLRRGARPGRSVPRPGRPGVGNAAPPQNALIPYQGAVIPYQGALTPYRGALAPAQATPLKTRVVPESIQSRMAGVNDAARRAKTRRTPPGSNAADMQSGPPPFPKAAPQADSYRAPKTVLVDDYWADEPVAAAAAAASAASKPKSLLQRGLQSIPTVGKVGAGATGAAGLGLIGGAMIPNSAYDTMFSQVNKGDWDPDRFGLKWERAGLEGGPMSQLGLFFQQPMNTLRQLTGGGREFNINNLAEYGDQSLQKTVMLPNGQIQSVYGFQPSEDLQWLMDSGLKQYQMPKQRRSTFDRLLRRPYDY